MESNKDWKFQFELRLYWECVCYLVSSRSRPHALVYVWILCNSKHSRIPSNANGMNIIYTQLKIDWCAESRIQANKQASRQANINYSTYTHKLTHTHEREYKHAVASTLCCDVVEKTVGNKKEMERRIHSATITLHSRVKPNNKIHTREFCCVFCVLCFMAVCCDFQCRAAVQRVRERVYWHFSMFLSCAIECIPKVKNSSERHT